MSGLIALFVDIITRLHTKIMGLNDAYEWAFSDKMLHFIVIGLFGFLMLLIIQPLFKWFANHDGILFVTFSYVFTVVLTISFAIEFGQAYSGAGEMDFYDIASGLFGFFVFFGIYLAFYLFDKRYHFFSKLDKRIEKTVDNLDSNKK